MLRQLLLASALFLLPSASLHSLLSLEAYGGYRSGSFSWSIAGLQGSPNVLSELVWSDLRIAEFGASMRIQLLGNMVVQARGGLGRIFDGKNRDSDYARDGREGEFSRSLSRSDEGHVSDLSVAYGRILSLGGVAQLTAFVGYSQHEQELKLKKGVQVVSSEPSELGPIEGLNSSYQARWSGPWTGTSAALSLLPVWSLQADFEYHRAEYRGKGHWNLRDDFLEDFLHRAPAEGWIYRLGTRYSIAPCLSCGLFVDKQEWRTGAGKASSLVEVEVLNEAEEVVELVPVRIETRLNRVKWRSWSLSGQLSLEF